MTTRVLITGSTGYLGSRVVKALTKREGWEVYGIDVREPRNGNGYARFVKGSVTDARLMRETFDEVKPDIVVHLAFVVTSTHDRKHEEAVAIAGATNVLAGCDRVGAKKVVFLSSVAAYGAFDDNDTPLTETSRIQGVQGYGYSRLKAITDGMATRFMEGHPQCDFVLLRPCLFIGPNTKNNFFDVLKYPVVPQVFDRKGVRDPEFQFIHEDDMADCVVAAIDKPVRGIFNIAGEGKAPFSALIRRLGKRRIGIPSWILYPATALLWKLHLVTSPPAQLNFIRYPWVMDVGRMRRELFTPTKSTIEAFDEYARTHR